MKGTMETQTVQNIWQDSKKFMKALTLFSMFLLLYALLTYFGIYKLTPDLHQIQLHRPSYGSNSVRPNRQNILLMTTFRSGSSFVGEILQHIPDNTYVFEPLMLLHFGGINKSTSQMQLSQNLSFYISNILDCNYEVLQTASRRYFSKQEELRMDWMKHSFPGFDSLSKAILSCRAKTNHIIKTIRASYLKDTLPLLKRNIKIIYLVRDPRGTFSSRLKLKVAETGSNISAYLNNPGIVDEIRESVTKHCNHMKHNLDFSKQVIMKKNTLKNTYLFLRYEDFAKYPYKMTGKLYRYLLYPISKRLSKWLRKKTNGTFNGSFSTSRNSMKTAEAWRNHLPYPLVEMIQQECSKVLHDFGYVMVDSENMLKKLNVSVTRNKLTFDEYPHL